MIKEQAMAGHKECYKQLYYGTKPEDVNIDRILYPNENTGKTTSKSN